jgi:hypothetical protein
MKRRRTEKPDEPLPARPPFIIGWKEYVDFPDWGVRRVKAKIDTGARTSCVHVENYEIHQRAEGPVAELRLSLNRKQPEQLTVVHTPVIRMVAVTDSGGHQELRPVVATAIRLGPVVKQVLLTVTNRESMLFRMLLARKALEEDFIVDVARKYVMRKLSG